MNNQDKFSLNGNDLNDNSHPSNNQVENISSQDMQVSDLKQFQQNNQIVSDDLVTNNASFSNNTNNVQSNSNVVDNGNNQGMPNNSQVSNFNNTMNMQNQNGNYYNNQGQFSSKKRRTKWPLVFGIGIVGVLVVALSIFLLINLNKDVSRTFMIYMVGSDLEFEKGLATVDLNEIDYNKMNTDKVNVVVIVGGSKKWHNDFIDGDETSIYQLTANGYEKVKQQSLQNMGDSQVLSNYLNYVYDNYKTDRYDLIFWNHGGAIDGSEYDALSSDNLSLSEMKKGLSQSSFSGKNKLELVMFRTCLNGSIEVANTFKDYSNYLVASEEVTLGSVLGGPLSFINDVLPDDTSVEVGRKFIESYKGEIGKLKEQLSYSISDESIYSTYSLIDLSKIDKTISSLNDFFASIQLSSDYNLVAKIRSNLYQYAASSGDDSYDMVDLYNLVTQLKDISPEKADILLKNLDDCIVYNWATNSDSRGLSIYFPYNGFKSVQNKFLTIYNGFSGFGEYNKFINNFKNIQTNGVAKYSFSENKIESNVKETAKDSDFTIELTEEQLKDYAKAQYFVFKSMGDGYYYPIYMGSEVSLNSNKLQANLRGTGLKLIDKEDKTEGEVPIFEISHDDKYIKYNVFAIGFNFTSENVEEWKSNALRLTIGLDKKTGEVSLLSAVISNSDNVSTIAVDLNDYDNIEMVSYSYQLLDENGNVDMEWLSKKSEQIVGYSVKAKNMGFGLSDFDDKNEYYGMFRIYDINNNIYYSKLIKMN